MGRSALVSEHSSFLTTPKGPNSAHVEPATATDPAPVPPNRQPAAVIYHTGPYITHNHPAGSMPSHHGFQHSAVGDPGVVAQNYSLLRRSSSCSSSLKSLAAHVQHDLLLQQGPRVCVAPGTHVHYADAAATAAPTSPKTPGGSPRDSPSTATLSTAGAAAIRHSSSPRFKQQQQQQQGSAAVRPQRSNLMALADAAVACQQQQSGAPTVVAPVGSGRVMGLGNRVVLPNPNPHLKAHEAPLAPAVPGGAAAAGGRAYVSTRPAALQCDGFSDVYTSCGLPPAAAASTVAAAAYLGALPQKELPRSNLGTAAAAAAAPCLTKASLQNRLSQELEQSPLLTVLLSRLVRRLRQQQQQGSLNGGAKQVCESTQQQQQQGDSDLGDVEYAAIMPGVLQQQHGNSVSSSGGSNSSSSSSCECRVVRLTKRSYVELPAGCLLVGPGGAVTSTAAAVTAAGAARSSLSLQQQQQQCMPGGSPGLRHCSTATGASPKSFHQQRQQQQCCVQQQGVAIQSSPAAAAAVQQQQQQPNAAFTAAHTGHCSTLNMQQQQQQQQAVVATIQRSAITTTNQHPEVQQMQTTDCDANFNSNAAETKCVSNTTQRAAPSGASATHAAAAPAARVDSSRHSCVGFVHKRPREFVAGLPTVMVASAGTVPVPAAGTVLIAATAAGPKNSSQQLQHPLQPAEAHTSISVVGPCREPITHLPYKRRCTINAAGSAAAAATGSHGDAIGQQRQEPAAGSAARVRQQQRLLGQRWSIAPSPLTSSYPK